MDKLRALTYFLAVAEHGSFIGAARALGVPGSSVSRRVHALEASLGAALFTRTTRAVRLTELGYLYLEHTRPLVKGLDHADALIGEQSQQASGRLRITSVPAYGTQRLLPVLNDFCVQYPKIVVEFELTDRVLNLDIGDVDIAIRITAHPPLNAVARKLTSNRVLLVAAPGYFSQYGIPTTLAELQTHRALKYLRSTGASHWQYRSGQDAWRTLEMPASFISNSSDALLAALDAHRGLALLPEWAVHVPLAEGRLQAVTLSTLELSVQGSEESVVYLLYHRPKYALKKVRLAVDYLRQRLEAQEFSNLL